MIVWAAVKHSYVKVGNMWVPREDGSNYSITVGGRRSIQHAFQLLTKISCNQPEPAMRRLIT